MGIIDELFSDFSFGTCVCFNCFESSSRNSSCILHLIKKFNWFYNSIVIWILASCYIFRNIFCISQKSNTVIQLQVAKKNHLFELSFFFPSWPEVMPMESMYNADFVTISPSTLYIVHPLQDRITQMGNVGFHRGQLKVAWFEPRNWIDYQWRMFFLNWNMKSGCALLLVQQGTRIFVLFLKQCFTAPYSDPLGIFCN